MRAIIWTLGVMAIANFSPYRQDVLAYSIFYVAILIYAIVWDVKRGG